MQNLYNELVGSITEYSENGEARTRPPTPLMLRAARTLQTLVGVNETNTAAIQSLQVHAVEDHDNLARLHAQIRELTKENDQFRAEQKNLYTQLLTKENDESLRKNSEQQESQPDRTGSLGDWGGVDFGCDSRSEGGIRSEDCGLGSN